MTVRLFGPLPAAHPYAGVDQPVSCTKDAWDLHLQLVDATAARTSTTATEWFARIEGWATVPIASTDDAMRTVTGHFTAGAGDAILVWDGAVAMFSKTVQRADTIGRRPGITSALSFDFRRYDLSRVDVCNLPGLPASEVSTCASDRWKNLARPWEKVFTVDLNGDGVDDVVGLVNVDDTASSSQLGLWALLSRLARGEVARVPQLLAVVDARFRDSVLLGGDFDGSGAPQIASLDAHNQVLEDLVFECSACDTPVVARSEVLADVAPKRRRHGETSRSHDVYAARVLGGSCVSGRPCVPGEARLSAPRHASYYVMHQSGYRWSFDCPVEVSVAPPRSSMGVTANRACLAADPLGVGSAATPDVRDVASDVHGLAAATSSKAKLDDAAIRNVVLSAGTYMVDDTLTVSTLDASGSHQPITKRLIGQGATIVAQNRYYAIVPDGAGGSDVTDVVPQSPADTAAEVARLDKCRAYRSYDDTGTYSANLPPSAAAVWYRYLRTECPVVQTLGSHVELSGLTIDTTTLSLITTLSAPEGDYRYPSSSRSDVGYYADGWALPYDEWGVKNSFPAYRVIDTSQPPDEDIRITRSSLLAISAAGIQTESAPMSVRDLLVEDLSCTTSDLHNIANCIEVDAAPMLTWPYDTSYRTYIPFSPPQTENYTIRKGPDDDSYCDLPGNSETVRISGAIGLLVDGCTIHKGLNGGVFLYVTDTGAKLDATLRNVTILFDPTQNPHFAYDPDLPASENDERSFSISGAASMSRNTPFNYRLDLPSTQTCSSPRATTRPISTSSTL